MKFWFAGRPINDGRNAREAAGKKNAREKTGKQKHTK